MAKKWATSAVLQLIGRHEGRVGVPHVTYIVTDPMTMKIYLKPQLQALVNRNWQVSVICGGDKALLPAPEEIPGGALYHVPMQREINLLSDSVALVRLFFLLVWLRPTVVNAGTPKAGLLGMIASRLAGINFRIYQLHGLRLETATGFRRRLLLLTEWLACWCSHKVLSVSKSLRDKVVELGVCKSEKVAVLGSGSCAGIHVADFAPTPDRLEAASVLRNNLGITPDASVVGFIGRLTKDKGIVELLSAFELIRQKLCGAYLILIGAFEAGDPIPADIRQKMNENEYIRHIEWTDDPRPYLHLMDVFVLPTHREGLPGVLLEAAAAGTPIVVTDATGVNDIVEHGYSALISPIGDVHSIAHNILEVLLNPALAQKLSHCALRKVEAEFSRDKVLQQLESFYEYSLHRGVSEPMENCRYAGTE
jgi:glycosyltransferase involved in cell wall biosynthesis